MAMLALKGVVEDSDVAEGVKETLEKTSSHFVWYTPDGQVKFTGKRGAVW